MTIEFTDARYIKLGKGGMWNDVSLNQSEIHFGYGDTPHEIALTRDLNAIRQCQAKIRRTQGSASTDAGAIFDFYSLPKSCLWITFARGHLYWTLAETKVIWLGDDGLGHDSPAHGQRMRRCDPWSRFDVNGNPLTIDSLSTSLTKVAGYRGTICRIGNSLEYLRRRICGIDDPLLIQARSAEETILRVLDQAIARLHQSDFETLVDVIFARSGWHRTTALGGTQEFIDLALEQPATSERAAVQVKSSSDQSVLAEYVARFDAAGSFDRLFFVCHTALPSLIAPDRPDIQVWQGQSLSKKVFRLGLTDWVLEKIA